MEIEFADDELRQLYTDSRSSGRYSQAIEKAFRKRVDFIIAAPDVRDLYAWNSLQFEKLEGRGEQRSIRLNKQWRMIVELVDGGGRQRVRIVGIEDYH